VTYVPVLICDAGKQLDKREPGDRPGFADPDRVIMTRPSDGNRVARAAPERHDWAPAMTVPSLAPD
jgi:hypothetical protein